MSFVVIQIYISALYVYSAYLILYFYVAQIAVFRSYCQRGMGSFICFERGMMLTMFLQWKGKVEFGFIGPMILYDFYQRTKPVMVQRSCSVASFVYGSEKMPFSLYSTKLPLIQKLYLVLANFFILSHNSLGLIFT